jgi:hypothetical protein
MFDATLSATVTGDDVDLALSVENTSDESRTLSFRSGQRAEFVAEQPETGETVWRYGDTRMFTMALASEEFAPGETATYTATWRDAPSGAYRVRAWIVAKAVSADAQTTVTVA